jgi:hypothetical protein
MHYAGKAGRLETARRLGQQVLYEVIPAMGADVSTDTTKSTPVATDSAPSSSPPNAGETTEPKVEFATQDLVQDLKPVTQPPIAELHTVSSIIPRRTSAFGKDDVFDPLPEWRRVPFDLIGIHPILEAFYRRQSFALQPQPACGYLSPHGISRVARCAPIQLVIAGSRLLCFAGVRLYQAALQARDRITSIEALVYSSIADKAIREGMEIDEQVLSLWYRETAVERKAHELYHLEGADPHGLTLHDQNQQQLSELFQTCKRTIQYQAASRRKTQKT